MLRFGLIPLALCAAFALPSAASADSPSYEVEYAVAIDVTATWSYAYFHDRGGQNTDRSQYSASTRITGKVNDVLFRNGRLITADRAGLVDITATGGGTQKITRWNPIHQRVDTDEDTCTAGGTSQSAAAMKRAEDQGPDANRERLFVRLSSHALFAMECNKFEDFNVDLARPGMEFPEGTFDYDLSLPLEAIGMGTIIENVSAAPAQRSPQWCPGAPDPHVTDCQLNWSGTLTFTKVDEHQYGIEPLPGGQTPSDGIDEDLLVPLVPPKPPAPPAVPASQPRSGGPGVLLPGTAKRVGSKLVLAPTCPAGCRGTVVIAGRKLRFKVAAGARKVTIKLPAAARKAKRAKVTLVPAVGSPVTRTVKVR